MDFFEVVKERHSIRAFAETPIEPEQLRTVLDTANCAPSAGNLQAYEIYAVLKPSKREALARAAGDQEFVACAPVVLVFCAHPARSASKYEERGTKLYALQDATIACTFAMLAATASGLASVWVGAFDDNRVRQAIGAPEGIVPIAMLPIGYASEGPETTSRRSLEGLVHRVA